MLVEKHEYIIAKEMKEQVAAILERIRELKRMGLTQSLSGIL
jgi:hypothetical protein